MKKIVILAVISIAVIAIGYKVVNTMTTRDIISPEDAKAKAEEFINNNLMQPGSQATVKEVTEENGLYKIVVEVGGRKIDSYLTKDGSKFFPQAMDTIENEQEMENTTPEQNIEPQVSVKKERPEVELFVMSYCPYGTQIEKGILPVLEILGDKIDFKLKFCDYAMHDKIELDEQLNQYCIQKEEPAKLLSYSNAFLEDGDSTGAISKAGVDTSKLSSCVASTDKEFKVTEKYSDKTTWAGGRFPVFDIYKADNEKYGVTGSPGLVINGIKMGGTACSSNSDCHTGEICVNAGNGKICSMQRDPESIKKAICAGFNNAPEECSQQLSATTPSPGFGFSESGSDSSGICD